MSEAVTAERWSSRWADRVNPIVLKEIRQGLRARTFWAFFGLMLVACILISLTAVATAQSGTPVGEETFTALWVGLGIVWFLVIPYGTYRSLVREREQETWVLLTLTGLGSKRILRGKIGSALVQAALYGSAAGPFLLFSYYLNGIDLPTIGKAIGLSVVWMVFLTCVACCAATFGEHRMGRSLVQVGVVIGLFFCATSGPILGAQVMVFPSMLDWNAELAWQIVIWVWAMLALGNVFFQAAAARMALATEDYARGPRMAVLIGVVGTIVVTGLAALFSHDLDLKPYFVDPSVLLIAMLWVVGLFMATEPAAVHPVHRDRPGWKLLRPGPLNGFRFVLLISGALTGLCAVLVALVPTADHRSTVISGMVLALVYLGIYLALPLALAGLVPRGRFRPVLTRTIAVALVGAASILPPIFAIMSGAHADDLAYNFLDPVVGVGDAVDKGASPVLIVGLMLAALALVGIADRLLDRHEREIGARSGAPPQGERTA